MLNRFSEIIQNEAEEQNGGFIGMLLGTLRSSVLGNIFTGKVIIRAGYGDKKWTK